MRGVVWGSLGLIALYALVQPGASTGVTKGTGVLVSMLQHLMSAQVAGIPQRKSALVSAGQNALNAQPAPTGGGGIIRPDAATPPTSPQITQYT